LQRRERTIKYANGVQANIGAIRDLFLELNNGFVLRLKEVLYVPSLHRNLISVSKLDDDLAILVMANVRYLLMINLLVVPSNKRSFIYYLLLKCE